MIHTENPQSSLDNPHVIVDVLDDLECSVDVGVFGGDKDVQRTMHFLI
jgi:hypothetical protein